MSFDRRTARESSHGESATAGTAAPGKRTQVDLLSPYAGAQRAGEATGAADEHGHGEQAHGDHAHGEQAHGAHAPGARADGEHDLEADDSAASSEEGELVSQATGSAEEGSSAEAPSEVESGGDGATAAGDSAAAEHPAAAHPVATASRIDPPISRPLEIRSSTLKSAPGGAADTRTKVAVGEVVRLVGSVEGAWSANHGKVHDARGMHALWTAPATPATTTIRLSSGGRVVTKKFTVIAPNHLSMRRTSVDSFPKGVQGVGMITNVTIGPSSVSFGNVEWLEVPGGPSHIFGYFKKHKKLDHHPNPDWLKWNDANTGLQDHASLYRWPKPWSPGGFQWDIPNKYRVAAAGGNGHVFTTTHQVFRITDKTGTTTITKGGAHVSRTP